MGTKPGLASGGRSWSLTVTPCFKSTVKRTDMLSSDHYSVIHPRPTWSPGTPQQLGPVDPNLSPVGIQTYHSQHSSFQDWTPFRIKVLSSACCSIDHCRHRAHLLSCAVCHSHTSTHTSCILRPASCKVLVADLSTRPEPSLQQLVHAAGSFTWTCCPRIGSRQ